MNAEPASRFDLKDLHQEIDFLDRKIAYCQTYEKFDSDHARAVTLQKLVTKREGLVKTALKAVSRGIEFDPKYLPRSFKESATGEKAAS